MKTGIAPDLLVRQVKNTASWLWDDSRVPDATRVLDAAASTGTAYLELLLTAHFATVATFIPTDVDARIRHHAWQAMSSGDEIASACDAIDRVASWDVHSVSERVHDHPRHGSLSGHDGEWLAVRAGAIGRAAVLGAADVLERIVLQVDAELDREEAICRDAFDSKSPAKAALSVATIVAHNLGDLSRVVAEWPKHDVLTSIRDRWVRLGHADAAASANPKPLFTRAGALNKAIVAHENHRFLPLRKPKALRNARALLLPIGPWFDAWGETIAKNEHLEVDDRAEVLEALLEVHSRDANQEGCLRAIAGMHRATRGGIELYVPSLPARMRKDALRGRVRDALDITEDHFAARIDRRYRSLAAAGAR